MYWEINNVKHPCPHKRPIFVPWQHEAHILTPIYHNPKWLSGRNTGSGADGLWLKSHFCHNILIVFCPFERCKHRVTLRGPCLHESFCVNTKWFWRVPCKHENLRANTGELCVSWWLLEQMHDNKCIWLFLGCMLASSSLLLTAFKQGSSCRWHCYFAQWNSFLLMGYWLIFMLSRPFSLLLFSCKYGCQQGHCMGHPFCILVRVSTIMFQCGCVYKDPLFMIVCLHKGNVFTRKRNKRNEGPESSRVD